jgi:hypothetical protein
MTVLLRYIVFYLGKSDYFYCEWLYCLILALAVEIQAS